MPRHESLRVATRIAPRSERRRLAIPFATNTIVTMTPLQYLAYFPAAVFLGKIEGTALAWGLAIEVAWVVFFAVLSRVLFYYGTRRYSAFGG